MTDHTVPPRANAEILKTAVELDNFSYDQQRDLLAEEMGVRVATLDTERKKALKEPAENEASSLVLNTPEPCADPVDGVIHDLIQSQCTRLAGGFLLVSKVLAYNDNWIIRNCSNIRIGKRI